MALSNWDTLAINHLGESTNGVFVSPQKLSVSIRKNWLVVVDEVGKHLADIQYGEITIKDTHIVAIRGPQQGIYAAVFSGYEEKAVGMLCIGVYGFIKDQWVGVQQESVDWFIDKLHEEESWTESINGSAIHGKEPVLDIID